MSNRRLKFINVPVQSSDAVTGTPSPGTAGGAAGSAPASPRHPPTPATTPSMTNCHSWGLYEGLALHPSNTPTVGTSVTGKRGTSATSPEAEGTFMF